MKALKAFKGRIYRYRRRLKDKGGSGVAASFTVRSRESLAVSGLVPKGSAVFTGLGLITLKPRNSGAPAPSLAEEKRRILAKIRGNCYTFSAKERA